MNYDEVVASLRKEASRGLSVEAAVVILRKAGLTITQSMKVLTEVFGISLGEAKGATAGHAVWADVAKAAKPLHEELEAIVLKDGDKNSS